MGGADIFHRHELSVWCVPPTIVHRRASSPSAQEAGSLVEIPPPPPRWTRTRSRPPRSCLLQQPQMAESEENLHLIFHLHLRWRLVPGSGAIGIGRVLMGAVRRRRAEGGGNPLVSNLLESGRRGRLFSFPSRALVLHALVVPHRTKNRAIFPRQEQPVFSQD